MAKKKNNRIKWLSQPEAHDYPAAVDYLTLLFPHVAAKKLVARLEKSGIVRFTAKDIFRASRLSLLGISNSHVEADRKKIKEGVALSPLLLVRHAGTATVIVADGYHRLCAVYSFDEDALVPCKIV